ncbi:ATP-binding cassette domain-containing protein [Actinokineospora pegani]|uniref:ATP-binding cassette domain-containing protein n=1 Tax=Actinokineospora pegani TaxID=2654637 RepID=UPI0012EAA173|nr:ATP-binding cassette domain-containing protein [Actinokineospora pegani]
MLASVGLGAAMSAYPRSLSLGEQQRVAAVRALAKRPALVLADEPTASLDRENRDVVLGLIESGAAGGACVVVATHDDHVANWATRRVRIDATGLGGEVG